MMLRAVSAAGNHYINEYAKSLGRAGKIASSAVLGGTVSELGGGKFANGAITGAFSMMFNDMMHQKIIRRQSYRKKYVGQVPLDSKVGMQNATYSIDATVISTEYPNGMLSIEVCGVGTNSYVAGDVKGAFEANLIADGNTIKSIPLEKHYKYYVTDPTINTNFIGEASFKSINANLYNSISVVVKGNWSVRDSSGGYSVPVHMLIKYPIYHKHTYKIK